MRLAIQMSWRNQSICCRASPGSIRLQDTTSTMAPKTQATVGGICPGRTIRGTRLGGDTVEAIDGRSSKAAATRRQPTRLRHEWHMIRA